MLTHNEAIVARNKNDLEVMARKLRKSYEKWDFTMSTQKIKYLNAEMKITFENSYEIEPCENYKH